MVLGERTDDGAIKGCQNRLVPRPIPRRHPRHRIDASWTDAGYALAACLRREPRKAPEFGDALVCLSVRSAFDLLLTALELAEGDEILVSAITHPDMVRIIGRHGLRAVPVEIDPLTLAPDPVALRGAVSERTRAILVAHLFGARVDLDGTIETARRHRLLVVEDCAQSIQGPTDTGDSRAGVSLFSFGFIKTATAFGGALAHVRDAQLSAAMRRVHERWPVQSRRDYAQRAVKGLAALALSRPWLFVYVDRPDRDVGRLARSIPPGDGKAFAAWLRRRPSPPLLRTLRRRLRNFPASRLRARTEAGAGLAAALPDEVFRPGAGASQHTYWLFPVVIDERPRLIDALRRSGFDASHGASQITAVDPAPPCAGWMMGGIVFLPAYPEMPASERHRLARVVHELV